MRSPQVPSKCRKQEIPRFRRGMPTGVTVHDSFNSGSNADPDCFCHIIWIAHRPAAIAEDKQSSRSDTHRQELSFVCGSISKFDIPENPTRGSAVARRVRRFRAVLPLRVGDLGSTAEEMGADQRNPFIPVRPPANSDCHRCTSYRHRCLPSAPSTRGRQAWHDHQIQTVASVDAWPKRLLRLRCCRSRPVRA